MGKEDKPESEIDKEEELRILKESLEFSQQVNLTVAGVMAELDFLLSGKDDDTTIH
ncbi:hypothetical protein JW758_05490 [Candidatus Peregrinibacteria bacterium]|nr:hypothetical protein [Candidatus Peregrinibacteria bacterium]